MTFDNKVLTCCDCGIAFVFSSGEQEFFTHKGLSNEPKRCPNCRVLTRLKRNGRTAEEAARVGCADCGQDTVVPFKPTGRRPVYCARCLRDHRSLEGQTNAVLSVPAGSRCLDQRENECISAFRS